MGKPFELCIKVDTKKNCQSDDSDMNRRWETSVMNRAISTYGADNQTWQMLEELFELGLSICKLRREQSPERYANLVEERADVSIMLDQLSLIHGDCGAVQSERIRKLRRLEKRLNSGGSDEE